MRDAALLQSFPENYEFTGSNGAAYKMIGNAVPPLLAKKIAVSVSKSLKIKNRAVKKAAGAALAAEINDEAEPPPLPEKNRCLSTTKIKP